MKNFYGSKFNTVLLLIIIIFLAFFFKKEFYNPPMDRAQTGDPIPPSISGNKDDLVSFSIAPGQKVSGIMKVNGSVKNNYFFEANIVLNILDSNKKLLKQGHGTSTTDWMTSDPVSFEATLDFSGLPKGAAYIGIQNDNPSGIPANDKFIFIPVVIE